MLRDFGGALDVGMRGERADAHYALLERDAPKRSEARDVDEELGRRKAHVERGNEALAAGEDLRARALDELERLRQRARFRIGKRRRLQASVLLLPLS